MAGLICDRCGRYAVPMGGEDLCDCGPEFCLECRERPDNCVCHLMDDPWEEEGANGFDGNPVAGARPAVTDDAPREPSREAGQVPPCPGGTPGGADQ